MEMIPTATIQEGFGSIFSRKIALMDLLISKDKLVSYPISLSNKKGQQTIREMMGYFIEELAEAHEQVQYMYESMSVNMESKAIEYHGNFHEEIADCWEFIIEILIYSGIDYPSLVSYYQTMVDVENTHNLWDGIFFMNHVWKVAEIRNESSWLENPDRRTQFYIKNPDPMCNGMRGVNISTILHMGNYCWEITSKLMRARNQLKAKPWRESIVKVDINNYHQLLMEAFQDFMALNVWLGLTPASVLEQYKRKNDININRQKTGY